MHYSANLNLGGSKMCELRLKEEIRFCICCNPPCAQGNGRIILPIGTPYIRFGTFTAVCTWVYEKLGLVFDDSFGWLLPVGFPEDKRGTRSILEVHHWREFIDDPKVITG